MSTWYSTPLGPFSEAVSDAVESGRLVLLGERVVPDKFVLEMLRMFEISN